jgi:hypothetical protein
MAIGTTITVYHKEMRKSWFGLRPSYETWVETAVDIVRVTNLYDGILPSLAPGVSSISCQEDNNSRCDCRLWSVGIGIKVKASSPGTPDWDTTRPDSGASLEVRSVRANGAATINRNDQCWGDANTVIRVPKRNHYFFCCNS